VSSIHVFDSHVETANRWIKELSQRLGLPPGDPRRAVHALRAGLHAIRDRLPACEVLDLGAQLPTLIRGLYYEGWTLQKNPARIRSRAAMIARVEAELGSDERLDALDVLRAVIHLLGEHISAGELADIVATLPRPIAALWRDVADNEADVIAARARPRAPLTRHTGYSR
jgi:uncharacterized protein (DUF2267 family)